MITEELRKYILSARAAGVHPDAIRAELLQIGWAESDIAAAFKGLSADIKAPFNPELHSKNERRLKLATGLIIVGLIIFALVTFIRLQYF